MHQNIFGLCTCSLMKVLFFWVVADTHSTHLSQQKQVVLILIFTPYQGQQEVLVIPGGVTNNVAGDRGLEPDLVFLFDLVHADLGP